MYIISYIYIQKLVAAPAQVYAKANRQIFLFLQVEHVYLSRSFLGSCEMYANLCNTYAKHRFPLFWLLLRPKEHVFSLLNFSTCVQTLSSCPVAEFIDPSLGNKVNSGIGLSYRPASPCILAWRAGTTNLCLS
jgi:hypothetical protein